MRKYKFIPLFIALSIISHVFPVFSEQGPEIQPEYNYLSGYSPLKPVSSDIEHTPEYIKGNTVIHNTYTQENLPSSYDSVKENIVTSAKNQRNTGSCWAFSTLSAMETNMIKKGYADENIDYSERHLAYFTHTPNSFTGDGVTNYSSEYGYYGGDHPVYAGQHLAGWQGAELEQNYPFGLKDEMADPDESSRYSSYSHLQDYNIIDVSKVKREIMEYGSVTAGYYDNRRYLSSDYAYYQNIYNNNYGNHSITIVGWDDNYPLENFDDLADKPSAPGAWKVKNSWGNTWGDNGYFWISYEEKSLGDFVSFNAEPADNYQIIHQYDGAQWSSLLTLEKSANIFTADENEVLKAVGFYTSHNSSSYLVDPINYSINIYKLYDNLHGPENGVIVSSVSGTIENDGYHTIELENYTGIKKGESFSVVLSLKHPSGQNAYHVFEGTAFNNHSNSGESYKFTSNSWADTSGINNNACIKAYASIENFTVSYNTNGGNYIQNSEVPKYSNITIPENPSKNGMYFAGWYKDEECTTPWDFETDTVLSDMTLYAKWSKTPVPVENIVLSSENTGLLVGDSLKINASVTPYYATDQTLSWTSSGSGAAVENGIVTGISNGAFTITAHANDGSNKSAEYEINVYNPLKTVSFRMEKPVYKTTDKIYYQFSEPNASRFDLHIVTPDGRTLAAANMHSGYSVQYDYKEGQYSAYIIAYDPLGNFIKSETKIFWVTNSPILIVKQFTNGFQAGGYNGPEGSQIIMAYYDSGRLVKAEIYNAADALIPIIYNYENTSVKFMWWNSAGQMTPVTSPIITGEYADKIFTAQ